MDITFNNSFYIRMDSYSGKYARTFKVSTTIWVLVLSGRLFTWNILLLLQSNLLIDDGLQLLISYVFLKWKIAIKVLLNYGQLKGTSHTM